MLQKWPYFDQNHGLTLLETSQFFEFFNFLFFYWPRRRFFVLDYRKSHFRYQYCLTKKVGKMAIFGPKPWVNPFGKMSMFWILVLLFFHCLERRFFVLDYRKSHFPNQYCLTKKVGKMAIFGPKPWLNPFGKTSIFRHSKLLVFIAKKGVFFF